MDTFDTQVAVVGAGAAGLYAAICAAREGADVTLISAPPLAQSSTYWAQGGLAAAIADDDSPERHLADTVAAGRGAVRVSAARVLCEEAPDTVEDLAALGMRFDTTPAVAWGWGLRAGARAARSAAAEPPADRRAVEAVSASVTGPPTPSPATRAALWQRAGLERDAQGLAQLSQDPHPLASLIGRCGLARAESRGAHRRRDFPAWTPRMRGST